jgi:streptogrisin C
MCQHFEKMGLVILASAGVVGCIDNDETVTFEENEPSDAFVSDGHLVEILEEDGFEHRVLVRGGDDGVQIDAPPGVVAQTAAEAREEDLMLTAQAHHWSIDEARANRESTEAVGRLAVKLARERPDIFVGSVVAENPLESPAILVKGDADSFVERLIREERAPIRIVDNQPYSFREIDQRIQATHSALKALGYRDIVVAADIRSAGRLQAHVKAEPELRYRPIEVSRLMPPQLRDELDLTVSPGWEGTRHAAFGGMRVTATSSECMSGWTLGRREADGWVITGVSTAGHCVGINTIWDPTGDRHGFLWMTQHIGEWGDVERHTVASDVLISDEFYATDTSIRDVGAVEPAASISVNESICFYSRQRGIRFCDADVAYTNVSVYGAGRLILMDQSVAIAGDSGGGWSWNNTAYGSQVGNAQVGEIVGDLFSVADYYDEALGDSGAVVY